MQMKKCMGCMADLENLETVCPHCGFHLNQYIHPVQALPVGSILHGRYLLGKVLGQGGFGITYIAQDMLLNVRVAVKEYFPQSQTGRVPGTKAVQWGNAENADAGQAILLKEAQRMARIKNVPTVVHVQDIFAENNTAYLVMDYAEGTTLLELLRQKGTMSLRECVRLLIPVMDGLDTVHRHGLIHRDISPDNIMITPEGTPLLLDLGAAKDLHRNNGTALLVTKSGFSPMEQYTQSGKTGPWMDVYAMAATIVYSVTGERLPNAVERFFDDTMQLPSFPPEAERVMRKALAVSVENRYQTMAEFRAALTLALQDEQGEKQTAITQNVTNQAIRSGWKRSGRIIGFVAALCLLLGAAAFILGQRSGSKAEQGRIPGSVETQISSESTATETIRATEPKVEQTEPSTEQTVPETETKPEISYSVGDVVLFGSYEQDGVSSNGAEPIEWIVMEVQEDKMLLLSRKVIISGRYHESWASLTWEECSLRQWLNDGFLNEAFSGEEREHIPVTQLAADRNPVHKTGAGKDTADRVFIFSNSEAMHYLPTAKDRKGYATASAVNSGVRVERGCSWYWLRSPGKDRTTVSYINTAAEINEDGVPANYADGGVRPAIWYRF